MPQLLTPRKRAPVECLLNKNIGKDATSCLNLTTMRKMRFLRYFLRRFSFWKYWVSTFPGFQDNKIFTAGQLSSRIGGHIFWYPGIQLPNYTASYPRKLLILVVTSYHREENKIRRIKVSTIDQNRTPSSSTQPVNLLPDRKCKIRTKVNDLSLKLRELQEDEKREHRNKTFPLHFPVVISVKQQWRSTVSGT